jgi:hypothetical protein
MSISPQGDPGAGEQDAKAVHVDQAPGTQVGDHGMQDNRFTQVTSGRDALVAGRDFYVQDLHVHVGDAPHALPRRPGKLGDMTTAAERLLVPGPEEKQLAGRAGTWTVTATMWPAPGAEPIVTDGLVAERAMIGLYLQETMQPAPGGTGPDFRRIDYLHYDRVEGRWKYVSMDTRLPVSIMPARSFGPAGDRTLRLQFEPLGFVGFGEEVGGTLMQSDMRITSQSPDRELKQQHFIVADGTAREWLAVQYEYRR